MTITKGFWRTDIGTKAEVIDVRNGLAIGWIGDCPNSWFTNGSSVTASQFNLIEPWVDAPKLRPWTVVEVPINAWFRTRKDSWLFFQPSSYNSSNGRIVNSSDDGWTPEEALRDLEHSTDGGKTWKPCGVEVKP